MSIFILTVHIIICFFIIIIVLLQVGRGAELGAAFGSMGQANQQRGRQSAVGRITTYLAVAFMITSFWLTYTTSDKAKTSVLETVPVSAEQPFVPADEKGAVETESMEQTEENGSEASTSEEKSTSDIKDLEVKEPAAQPVEKTESNQMGEKAKEQSAKPEAKTETPEASKNSKSESAKPEKK